MKTMLSYAVPRHRQLIRFAGAGLLLALLSGCAMQGVPGGGNSVAAMPNATPADSQLNEFLDDAAPGSVTQLVQSPWGPDVEIVVEERYFAASGRTCVRLNVTRRTAAMTLPQGKLACQVEGQGWFVQRLVTDALEAGER